MTAATHVWPDGQRIMACQRHRRMRLARGRERYEEYFYHPVMPHPVEVANRASIFQFPTRSPLTTYQAATSLISSHVTSLPSLYHSALPLSPSPLPPPAPPPVSVTCTSLHDADNPFPPPVPAMNAIYDDADRPLHHLRGVIYMCLRTAVIITNYNNIKSNANHNSNHNQHDNCKR